MRASLEATLKNSLLFVTPTVHRKDHLGKNQRYVYTTCSLGNKDGIHFTIVSIQFYHSYAKIQSPERDFILIFRILLF